MTTPIWHAGPPDIAALNANGTGCAVAHLGIEFTAAGADWVEARMPVDARTRQPYGILHGGASVLLAETLASTGAALTVDPATTAVAGMEINANHVRPARDGWVTGHATRDAGGRTTQVWSIRIHDAAGRLVCVSRCTMAVVPRDRLAAPAR